MRHLYLLMLVMLTACQPSVSTPSEIGDNGKGDSIDGRAPILLVDDPGTMHGLELRGFSLATQLSGSPTELRAGEQLLGIKRYADLVDKIEREIRLLRRLDGAGVGFINTYKRTFDVDVLRSALVHFDLIGVSNRIERRDVSDASCGEVRFIYRGAYAIPYSDPLTRGLLTRMPFTINLLFDQPLDPDGGCTEAARRWFYPGQPPSGWLADGPLLARSELRVVEINLGAERWPVPVNPELGGHVEYLLRAYRATPDGLEAMPLENTPDVKRLRVEGTGELRAWIAANLPRIDAGTAVLPARFSLSTEPDETRAPEDPRPGSSFSPRGLARVANRSFAQLFDPAAFSDPALHLERFPNLRTPVQLIRRLDQMSCNGCHQARSVAGFHFLGQDESPGWINGLAVGRSPHLIDELGRRRAYMIALAQGKAPVYPRGLPELSAGPGGHCALPDGPMSGAPGWSCSSGEICTDLDGDRDRVGVCAPTIARPGQACETGRVTSSSDARTDSLVELAVQSCAPSPTGTSSCVRTTGFYPGGACIGAEAQDDAMPSGNGCRIAADYGRRDGDVICANQPSWTTIECIGRGEGVASCAATAMPPAWMAACDEARPCRQDYVCQRVPNASPQSGACVPVYFLHQMRLDQTMQGIADPPL